MKKELKNRLILISPAFFAALLDILITIYFQPKEYWNGNLKLHNEANPIGSYAMNESIYGLFIIAALWLIIILIIGIKKKKNWISPISLFILICHTLGGCSWIMINFGFQYQFILIGFNTFMFLLINKKIQ